MDDLVMDGVIIEYKGTNRMRIVGSAQERTILAMHYYKARIQKAIDACGSAHRSPITDGPINLYDWNGRPSDIKCWKRNNKHADRGWMRHPKRTKGRYRNKQGYHVPYFPSIRNLVDRLI